MENEIAEATSSEAELQHHHAGVVSKDNHGYAVNENSTADGSRNLQNLTTYVSPVQVRLGYGSHHQTAQQQHASSTDMFSPQNVGGGISKAFVEPPQFPRPNVLPVPMPATYNAGGPFGQMMDPCRLHERPIYTYEELAIMALEILPSNKGSVADIYEVIQTYFPYYKGKPTKTWKSSLRHSISKSPYMRRVSSEFDEVTESDNRSQSKDPVGSAAEGAINSSSTGNNCLTSSGTPTIPNPLKRPRPFMAPIQWELYEPTEDECIAKKKPRRGFLPRELNKRSSVLSGANLADLSRKQPPPVVRLPVPGMYSCFPSDPSSKKIDPHLTFPAAPYQQAPIIYRGPVIAPEMYPYATSLLDLSRDKRQTNSTGQQVQPFQGTTKALQPDFNVAKLVKKPTSQLKQLRPKLLTSSTPIAPPHTKASDFSKTCIDCYSSQCVTVSASEHDYATSAQQTLPPKTTVTMQGLPPMPSTSETGMGGIPSHSLYPGGILQHNPAYPWPATTASHSMVSQTSVTPNQSFQQNRFPVPTNFVSPYQIDEKQPPISWKVQHGYLVQSAQGTYTTKPAAGASPFDLTMKPPATSSTASMMPPNSGFSNTETESGSGGYDYESGKFASYYPWQFAQSLQPHPYMPYQVPTAPPPSQAQRFPGMPANIYDISSTTSNTSSSGGYPMVPPNYQYLAEYMEQPGRQSTSSATPSLNDSVITKDSGLGLLSPEGSGRDTLSRPGSEDVIHHEDIV